MSDLKTKIGSLIIEELVGKKGVVELDTILESSLVKALEPKYGMNGSEFGITLRDKILNEFSIKYVEKNFNELSKAIDLESIKNLVTVRVARNVSGQFDL